MTLRVTLTWDYTVEINLALLSLWLYLNVVYDSELEILKMHSISSSFI